jgi:hypothetical protein
MSIPYESDEKRYRVSMSLSGVILLVSGITVGLGALIWSLVWLVGKGQETLVPATQKQQATFRSLLWPRFMEASDAELTSRQVGKLCLLLSAMYVLLIALGKVESEALADSFVFAVIGAGLFKCSRVAAVCGLAAYAGEQIWIITGGAIPNPIALLYMLAFISGIRASFAYHRLRLSSEAEVV